MYVMKPSFHAKYEVCRYHGYRVDIETESENWNLLKYGRILYLVINSILNNIRDCEVVSLPSPL